MLFFRKGWSPNVFELSLVAMIYGFLLFITLQRLKAYQEEAERVEHKWNLAAMRTAVHGQASVLRILGKERELRALIGENPVRFLDRIPRTYIGELDAPDIRELPEGVWYFDKSEKTLVYLLKNGNSLAKGQPNMLKYKVKLNGLPETPVKLKQAPTRDTGIVLEQVE